VGYKEKNTMKSENNGFKYYLNHVGYKASFKQAISLKVQGII